MKKKLFSILVIVCLAACACGSDGREQNGTESSAEEMELSEDSGSTTEVSDAADMEQVKELINHDLLSNNSLSSVYWVRGMIESGICGYAEEIKEPFEPVVNAASIFPKDLVILLEEALYDFSNLSAKGDRLYDRMLAELGADEYEMSLEEMVATFPELEAAKDQIESYIILDRLQEQMGAPDKTEQVFHIEGNQYLFEYYSGGTNGVRSLRLMEYTDGRFEEIDDYEVDDRGNGKLIKYQGDFYYVFLKWRESLGDFDGIGIYKIGEDATREDNLQIRYLPKEYIWKNSGELRASDFPDLESYLNVLQGESLSEGYRYLLKGGSRGDEEETFDLNTEGLKYQRDTVYKADIANLGIPVYMQRIGNGPRGWLVNFYLKDPWTDMPLQLDQLSITEHGIGSLTLVNIWFKDINDKTMTFSTYYVVDYSYLMNIVLLEGGETKQIQTWFLLPVREFVLEEGRVFSSM